MSHLSSIAPPRPSLQAKHPVAAAAGRPRASGSAPEVAQCQPPPLTARLSIGLWVAVVWYALETSQNVSRWMVVFGYRVSQTGYYDVEGSPIDRAVFSVLMAIAIVVLMSRRVRWGQLARNNAALLALFLYMLASVLWSDFPAVSFKRWVRSLIDVLMVMVILTDADPLEAECAVLRRALFLTIPVSIVFIKYFRALGTMWDEAGNEMWIGATTHKNVLGEVVMIGGIFFLFEAVRRRHQWRKALVPVAYVLMSMWVLKGVSNPRFLRSNTSIAGLVVGLLLLLVLHLAPKRAPAVARLFLVGVFVIGLAFVGVQELQLSDDTSSAVEAGIEASGRDVSLSGRTDLWNDLLRIAAEHPILGTGYGGFWIGNTHHLWEKHLWKPTQGHNGYIDIYLELGLVGLALFACVLVAASRGILKLMARNFEHGTLHLIFFTTIIFHNITESSYLRGSVDLWFLFLLSAFNFSSGQDAALADETEVVPAPVAARSQMAGRSIPPPASRWTARR